MMWSPYKRQAESPKRQALIRAAATISWTQEFGRKIVSEQAEIKIIPLNKNSPCHDPQDPTKLGSKFNYSISDLNEFLSAY